MTDISDQIDVAALQPSSATITPTSESVANRSLSELIEADKYQRANATAASDATFGLRFRRIRANGASE